MQYHFDLEGFEGRELAVEIPGVFSGPRLLVDGLPAPPGLQRLEYLLTRNDGTAVTVQLKPAQLGSILEVVVGDTIISVMEPLTWYQWIWIGVPFLLVVGGGCIGGGIGGACAMVNIRLFRSQANAFAQYAMTGVVSAVAIAGYIFVAVMFHLTIWGFGKKGEDVPDGKKTQPASMVGKDGLSSGSAAPKSSSVVATVQKYTLPEDWEKLQKTMDIQVVGGGQEKIVLEVKKAA